MKKRLGVILLTLIISLMIAVPTFAMFEMVLPEPYQNPFDILDTDIAITATPDFHGPVIDFTATWITDTNVLLDWTNPLDLENVMIRVGFGAYPTDPTAGYLVYYGDLETFNDTDINLDATGEAYYSAFSEYIGGYSVQYATDNVEGEGLLAISEALNAFVDYIPDIIYFLLIAGFLALSFWKKKMMLYFLSCPITIVYGSFVINEYSLVPLGVTLILFGVYCLYQGIEKAIGRA